MKTLPIFLIAIILITNQNEAKNQTPEEFEADEVEEMVEAIRDWVREEAAAHPTDYDPLDISRLLDASSPRHVTRYIDYLGLESLPKITALLKSNLKWRKSLLLNSLTPLDFPCEFWLAGFLHSTGTPSSRHGDFLIGGDLRRLGLYGTGLRDAWWTFSQYNFDQIDQQVLSSNLTTSAGERPRWIIYFSMAHVGIANLADIPGILNNYASLPDHFAGNAAALYLLDLHPMVEAVVTLIKNAAARSFQDIINIVHNNDAERFRHVKKRDLMGFLGGKLGPEKSLLAVTMFEGVLSECKPLRKMAAVKGWSEVSVRQWLDSNLDIIKFHAKALNYTIRQ